MAMPFKTMEVIREDILRGVTNLDPEIDVSPDSEVYVRATALATAVEGLYQASQFVARQILPDGADEDYQRRHAARYGLVERAASLATGGVIAVTGEPGSVVPAGAEARKPGGVAFVATATTTVGGDGSANVPAAAKVAGAAGNQHDAAAVTFVQAPSGIQSTASVSGMTGGTDKESMSSLMARLQFRVQFPPAGGNRFDYRRWALEVPGVVEAYVYPLRRGAGTVDVAIMTEGGPAGSPLVSAVQDYIDQRRPVKGECLVLAPTEVPMNITATVGLQAGFGLGAVTAAINQALDVYFAGLAPGATAYVTRVMAIISDTPGVVDFDLTAPIANLATLANSTAVQVGVKGTVTIA